MAVVANANTPILPLLSTVFTSIVEVFLLCLAGYVLASQGVLDRKTQKQLNKLNVSLFTPALLFSKVAFFLSPAKLRELWIIPIFFVLVTVVSMLVSFMLGWLFRLKRSQRSFAMAASMFMNSNSLPIALMQSLVVTVPGLKWGQDDNKNAMVGRALTYLVLYSTLGMVLRWSYGVRLLAQADPEPTKQHKTVGVTDSEPTETSPLLSSPGPIVAEPQSYTEPSISFTHSPSTTQVDTEDDHASEFEERPDFMPEHHVNFLPELTTTKPSNMDERSLRPTPMQRHTSFFRSFPNSPASSLPQTPLHSTPSLLPSPEIEPSYDNDDNDDADTERLPEPAAPRRKSTTLTRRGWRCVRRAWRTFNEFMTVPLWAALASLLVACIRPVQHTLEVHMEPVKAALNAAGGCSIPLTLIVLGAYFYTPPAEDGAPSLAARVRTWKDRVRGAFHLKPKPRAWRRRMTGDEALLAASSTPGRPGETATVVIAVLSRMIITPLLLLPLMAVAARFDIQSVFADPVFVVSNVLLVSSPPALTLAQITQAASGDAFERLISRTIFWSYCVITPPATIVYVVIGLLLAKL